MTTFRTLIVASMLSSLPVSTVLAQSDQTGNGGAPLSTEKAPNTTVVGQTKPPSRDASPSSVKPIERLTPRQAADDAISTRVCVGCAPDPNTTSSISTGAPAIRAASKPDVQLDELRTASEPKKQSDLVTVALASARREQAESAQEKTNGLWQSWLVSVCDGCGDQKPAKAWKLEDWPTNRSAPLTTGSLDHKPPLDKHQPLKVKQAAHHYGDMAADLSPENVDSIRRMPQQ